MKRQVIDLFSGVGGLSKGFFDSGFEIVLANEVDYSIANSYKKNHPKVKMINEDISKLDIDDVFNEYKNIDVIVGGHLVKDFLKKGKEK